VDAGERGARWVAFLVEVQLPQGARDDLLLVGRVVDHEVPREPHGLAVATQELRARGVEGPGPEVPRDLGREEPLEAAAHLAGRLVREGDGQDAVRRDARARDEVRDAVGDDPCLAAARAGEHEQGAVHVLDGIGLRLVQTLQGDRTGAQGALARGDIDFHSSHIQRQALGGHASSTSKSRVKLVSPSVTRATSSVWPALRTRPSAVPSVT